MKKIALFFLFNLLFLGISIAQPDHAIYNESDVPDYKLPNVLTCFNGSKVKSQKDWIKKRRPEILKAFTNEVYGKVPGVQKISQIEVWENSDHAINGLAIRKQLSLFFNKDDKNLEVNVLMYLPKSSQKVPVFLAYNFTGNHSVYNDANIRLTDSWVANDPSVGIINNKVTEQSRATASNRWPVDEIIKAGYGLVTVYYGDIDPDKNDFSDGIQSFWIDSCVGVGTFNGNGLSRNRPFG